MILGLGFSNSIAAAKYAGRRNPPEPIKAGAALVIGGEKVVTHSRSDPAGRRGGDNLLFCFIVQPCIIQSWKYRMFSRSAIRPGPLGFHPSFSRVCALEAGISTPANLDIQPK